MKQKQIWEDRLKTFIKDFEKKGSGYFQVPVILHAINVSFRPREEEQKQILSLFYTLVLEGIILPGKNFDNPNFPFLHVTEKGRKWLENKYSRQQGSVEMLPVGSMVIELQADLEGVKTNKWALAKIDSNQFRLENIKDREPCDIPKPAIIAVWDRDGFENYIIALRTKVVYRASEKNYQVFFPESA